MSATKAGPEAEGSLRKTREAAKHQVRAIRAQYSNFELGAFLARLVSKHLQCPRCVFVCRADFSRPPPGVGWGDEWVRAGRPPQRHAPMSAADPAAGSITFGPAGARPRLQGAIRAAPTICTTRAEFGALKEQGIAALKAKAADGGAGHGRA